jgi:predicted lipoprotein with Yx(FWY)xxD motif
MPRMSPPFALLAGVVVLLLAGCGSGGSSDNDDNGASGGGSGSTQATGTSETSGQPADVSTTDSGSLGTILVSDDRTLYLFEKDSGPKSACTGDCAANWPPLLTSGEPTASGEADPSKLGTTTRDDGTTQVTYAGHPLYFFVGDKQAGDTNGQDLDAFGAEWYALQTSGEHAEDKAGDDSGGSGGGYGY